MLVFRLSDYFVPLWRGLGFYLLIAWRFFFLLFKRKRKIKQLILESNQESSFNQTFLVVQFNFENALWYEFKNIKNTVHPGSILIQSDKVPSNGLELIVHGFKQKASFVFKLEPTLSLKTDSFITRLNGLNSINQIACQWDLLQANQILLLKNNVVIQPTKPLIVDYHTHIDINPIQLATTPFNQNEFI